MFTPARALRRASVGAEPMPEIEELNALHRGGFRPRRGQLMMVAAQSKTGKSALVQWMVDRWNRPGIYFSADMSARDTATRLVAMNTGRTTDEVMAALDEGDDQAFEEFEKVLSTRNTMFNFQSSPCLEDVLEEVSTYVEVYDEYPEVVVLDTLQKVREGEGGDYAGQSIVMDEMHSIARVTGALVIVVHHTSESSTRSVLKPPAKKDLKNKLSELPEIILTLALVPEEQILRVAVVAARNFPCDATGDTYNELLVDLNRCTFQARPPFHGWSPSDQAEEEEKWYQK